MFSFAVRYDTIENQVSTDVSYLMKVLRRRYISLFFYFFGGIFIIIPNNMWH
jgi:hypothetical protein